MMKKKGLFDYGSPKANIWEKNSPAVLQAPVPPGGSDGVTCTAYFIYFWDQESLCLWHPVTVQAPKNPMLTALA